MSMDPLETKIVQLQLAIKRSEDIQSSPNEDAIERHRTTIKSIIAECMNAKMIKEASKIAEKGDPEAIGKWSKEIEKVIEEADAAVKTLKLILQGYHDEAIRCKQEKEIAFERKLFEVKLKFEEELQQAKTKQEPAQKAEEKLSSFSAKLPQLQINRFDGSFEDWPRFWNQFSEIIDKANMPSVTKFACMKSFLDNRIKRQVDGLPFTSEGYNRAKIILKGKYGKTQLSRHTLNKFLICR